MTDPHSITGFKAMGVDRMTVYCTCGWSTEVTARMNGHSPQLKAAKEHQDHARGEETADG